MSRAVREFVADTLALVTFFTVTSGLNERFVGGMEWSEVAVARAIGFPLMLLTARPYGVWRSWWLARVSPRSRHGRLVADGLGLLLFQVPIYIGIVVAGGARGLSVVWATLGFALLMLVLGRPYGLWLGFIRRRFGLDTPGQKPMSLGG